MNHNMVLSYDYPKSKKGNGNEWMHLRQRPFQWPCGGVEAIHVTSPDAACPGPHWKPLDAAIRRLLAPYPLGSRQGNSKQKQRCDMYPLWRCGGTIAPIAQWMRSRAFVKATKHWHRARTCSDIAQSDTPMLVVSSISSWKRARVDMLAHNNNRG